MKGNRDMFYSNYQAGGIKEPNMIYNPPSGYNINSQYSAFGPGIMNGQMNPNQYQYTNDYQTNDYDERITKLERQIRSLDQRIRKLETTNTNLEDNSINDSNLYMI